MSGQPPEVLIVGAGASLHMFGERFLDLHIVGAEHPLPNLTFYDPRVDITLGDARNRPNLTAALSDGRARLVHTMPRQQFDVAVISTTSNRHAEATQAVLDAHGDRPPFFIQEKPLAASWRELNHFQALEPILQPISVVNEPFLLSRSVRRLVDYVAQQKAANPLREIRAWSSKRRKLANPHGLLGRYGVEYPHHHGGASRIAGVLLGPEHVEENVDYTDVDANYTRFSSDGRVIHVAQGLGTFVMNGYGEMEEYTGPPDDQPRMRNLSLRFADGQYVELDMEPVFPTTASRIGGYGLVRYFEAGKCVEVRVPDDPRREIVRYALQRARDPSLPIPPGVSLHESLQRSEALLQLRQAATETRFLDK